MKYVSNQNKSKESQDESSHICEDKFGNMTSDQFNWSNEMVRVHVANLFEHGFRPRDIVSAINSELILRGYLKPTDRGVS